MMWRMVQADFTLMGPLELYVTTDVEMRMDIHLCGQYAVTFVRTKMFLKKVLKENVVSVIFWKKRLTLDSYFSLKGH